MCGCVVCGREGKKGQGLTGASLSTAAVLPPATSEVLQAACVCLTCWRARPARLPRALQPGRWLLLHPCSASTPQVLRCRVLRCCWAQCMRPELHKAL